MKLFWASALSLLFLARTAWPQSLGDLARQERERKAQSPKSTVAVTTDQVLKHQVEVSPRLDPARKGDLDYLLELLSRPAVSPELLAAFIPLKDAAGPKLLALLGSTEPLKRVAPATALTVLGNSEGLLTMARLLNQTTETLAGPDLIGAGAGTRATATSEAALPLPQKIQVSREAAYALSAAKLGVWRFTEGTEMTPEQVVERLGKKGPIEIVGGVDNGQRIFNRALRGKDPNLRWGAIALIRVATGGKDFGFQPDQPPEQNQAAIQEITTFLTTERAKVIAQIGTKKK